MLEGGVPGAGFTLEEELRLGKEGCCALFRKAYSPSE